jgi:uncharacterized protein (DUF1810 family)
MESDPYGLARFVEAQASVYDAVVRELRGGRKQSHWMWFVFPQLRGLGSSATARHFGIGSLAEATAYLGHPVLGARLRECTGIVNGLRAGSISDVLGYPDDLKFGSSMTLFLSASNGEAVFRQALDRYFHGHRDERTLVLVGDTT